MHDESDFYSFENFLPEEGIGKLPYNEVSSILRTHDNQMWISMFGGGVCKIQTENKKFGVDRIRPFPYEMCFMRAMMNTGWGLSASE